MKMIDISKKKITQREAVVEAKVVTQPAVILAIKKKEIPKGDVLEASKLAGILAAKKTSNLIPLCHPIAIEFIEIKFLLNRNSIRIIATVKGNAKTGVEMEALTAASIAALTIYDMCKAIDRKMIISQIKLIRKTGGKSGDYERKD